MSVCNVNIKDFHLYYKFFYLSVLMLISAKAYKTIVYKENVLLENVQGFTQENRYLGTKFDYIIFPNTNYKKIMCIHI